MSDHKNAPWNKTAFDDQELITRYSESRTAMREIARERGVTVHTVYRRLRELGIARRARGDASRGTQAAEKNPNWNGGQRIDPAGYVVVVRDGAYVREHRVVAEQKLGRPLVKGEVVHHINGDRSDNRPENIEVLPSQSHHMRKHMTSEAARRMGALGLKAMRAAALEAAELGSLLAPGGREGGEG